MFSGLSNSFYLVLQAIQSIANPYIRDKALIKVITEYAQQGSFERSLELAETVSHTSQWLALTTIAEKYAQRNQYDESSNLLAKALQATKFLVSLDVTNALRRIAYKYAVINQYEKSLQIANSITENFEKANALAEVSYELAKLRYFEQALQTLQIVEEIPGVVIGLRSAILYEVAKSYLSLNNYDGFYKILKEIKDKYYQAATLGIVAERYAKRNQYERVLETISMIKHVREKEVILGKVAEKYIQINQDEQALEIVKLIQDSYEKNLILSKISIRSLEINNYDDAVKLVKRIKDSNLKSETLIAIAHKNTQNSSALIEKMKLFSLLSSLLENIKDFYTKVRMLCEIAEGYFNIKQINEAHKTISKAYQLTEAIESIALKVQALSKIVQVYAKANDDNRASEILSQVIQIAKNDEKLDETTGELYYLIVEKLVEINYSQQALKLILDMDSRFIMNKTYAILQLAQRYKANQELDKLSDLVSVSLEFTQQIEESSKEEILSSLAIICLDDKSKPYLLV